MFIKSVLQTGLSWPKLREASQTAVRLLEGDPHPFASEKWFADPAGLYLKLGKESGEAILVEVAGYGQVSMEEMLRPYLRQLHFDEHGVAQKWYPLGQARPIVVDPRRSFGMPVTERDGVPTDAIVGLHAAGDSIATIAAWYRTDEADVEAAIEFESSLGAPV